MSLIGSVRDKVVKVLKYLVFMDFLTFFRINFGGKIKEKFK